MRIKLEVDPEDWKMRGLSDPRCKQIEESNVADTGAMGDLIGLSQAQKMGFNESNMVGVNTRFNGINQCGTTPSYEGVWVVLEGVITGQHDATIHITPLR